MKKNILLVQSFLTLPLLTSSFILGSQKPKKSYAKAAQTGTQLKNSGSQSRKERRKTPQSAEAFKQIMLQEETVETEIPSVEQFDAVLPAEKPTLTKDIIKYISPEDEHYAQADFAEAKTHAHREVFAEIFNTIRALQSDDKGLRHVEPVIKTQKFAADSERINSFAQSTLGLQTEARGFDIFGRISNTFKSYKKAVIGYLQNNTFEVDNQDHLHWLDNAIIECVDTNDMKSLLIIAQECQEKYPSVRYSDSVSLFQFLNTTYTNQIQASHQVLQSYNQEYATEFNKKSAALKEHITQLSNTHKAMTANLAQTYENKIKEEQEKIKNLQNFIVKTSVLLDRPNNLKKVTLFTKNPLEIPANSIADVKNTTEQRLTSLITNSNLPLIQAPTSK